jgi:hypothetical protein
MLVLTSAAGEQHAMPAGMLHAWTSLLPLQHSQSMSWLGGCLCSSNSMAPAQDKHGVRALQQTVEYACTGTAMHACAMASTASETEQTREGCMRVIRVFVLQHNSTQAMLLCIKSWSATLLQLPYYNLLSSAFNSPLSAAAAGQVESEKVCQTGLEEEAELHWKADQAAALAPCQGIKHTFARIARECPDVKFLSLSVSWRGMQESL